MKKEHMFLFLSTLLILIIGMTSLSATELDQNNVVDDNNSQDIEIKNIENINSYTKTNNEIVKSSGEENKQNCSIFINPIETAQYGDNVNITGRLTDNNGKALTNKALTLTVNNMKNYIRSGETGDFILTTRATTIGTNNITVSYAGYDKYNPTNNTQTLEVLKKDCTLSLNPVNTTSYSDEAIITGTLIDKDGQALTNKALTLIINNAKKYLRTDNQGLFSINVKVYSIGTNNITVTYDGYGKYNPTTDSKTFDVVKKDCIITLDNIGYVAYRNNVTITGTLKDNSGNNLVNRGVTVSLNGKNKSIRTDANGNFNYTVKTSKINLNNISVSYAGYKNYNPYTANKTFNVFNESTTVYSGVTTNKFYKANLTTTEKVPTGVFTVTESIGNIATKFLSLVNGDEIITVNLTLALNKKGINENSHNLMITFAGFDNNNNYEDFISNEVMEQKAIEFAGKTTKNITYEGYMIINTQINDDINISAITSDVELLANSFDKSLKSSTDLLLNSFININIENPWTQSDNEDDDLFVDV